MFIIRFGAVAFALLSLGALGADTTMELLDAARQALRQGRTQEALALANKAIAQEPQNPQGYYFRGHLHEALDRYQEAVADYTRVLTLDPKAADAYQQRGSAHFKQGKINESIADFDKYIELRPERKASHWQRGISYYYAGRFDDGRRQFEGYQTFDSNDVENAVWRYLCMARSGGVAKARADMLKIGKDTRVPMKEIYELFGGRLQPKEVVAAAQAGDVLPAQRKQRLFYAHLYLGLYYETEGNKKLALEHLTRAADQHRIGHYMWDVARVHRDLLRKEGK